MGEAVGGWLRRALYVRGGAPANAKAHGPPTVIGRGGKGFCATGRGVGGCVGAGAGGGIKAGRGSQRAENNTTSHDKAPTTSQDHKQ